MATYSYARNYDGPAGKGVIKYNVSASDALMEPEYTKVTIAGQISGNTKALKSIGVFFFNADFGQTPADGMAYYKNVSIAKNTATTFTLSFLFPLETWQAWHDKPSWSEKLQPGFIFGTINLTAARLHDMTWFERVDNDEVGGFCVNWCPTYYNDMLQVRDDSVFGGFTIDSVAVEDVAPVSAMTAFGGMATVHSLPRVTVDMSVYSDYHTRRCSATLTLTGAMTGTYTIDGVTEKDTYYGKERCTMVFNLPTPTAAGTVSWSIETLDMYGNSGPMTPSTGNFEVLSYAKPYITSCAFERYQEVQKDTGYAHEASPSGEYIWLNLDANIAAVNSRNAWTATLTAWRKEHPEIAPTAGSAVYENTTGERRTVSTWALAGSDGQHIQLARDEDNLSDEMVLSAAFDWCLRLTLTDALGNSVTLLVDDDIRKDSAILDVGPYGVSVGARSTALAADPQFECSYPARFYGDVAVPAGGLLKVVRIAPFTSVNIAAKAVKSGTYTITTSDIGAGWTAVGVVGYSMGQFTFNVYRLRLAINSTDTIEYSVGNLDTSAHTGSLGCMVLCVRTGL